MKSRLQRGRAFPPVQISEKKGVRYLHLGGPAVQSAMRIRDPWMLELEYTRAMMCFLLFHPKPRDIALLGLGGGSLAKAIFRGLPQTRLDALEINPEVVEAARAFFHLPPNNERLDVQVADGAAFVHAHVGSHDVLMVDGYDAERIVEALASVDFYRACQSMLRPGGVAVFNLWGADSSFPVYFERLASVFGDGLLRLPSERKGNIIVFAFHATPPDLDAAILAAHAQRLNAQMDIEAEAFLKRLRAWNAGRFEG